MFEIQTNGAQLTKNRQSLWCLQSNIVRSKVSGGGGYCFNQNIWRNLKLFYIFSGPRMRHPDRLHQPSKSDWNG
jgi:hypothetical protein